MVIFSSPRVSLTEWLLTLFPLFFSTVHDTLLQKGREDEEYISLSRWDFLRENWIYYRENVKSKCNYYITKKNYFVRQKSFLSRFYCWFVLWLQYFFEYTNNKSCSSFTGNITYNSFSKDFWKPLYCVQEEHVHLRLKICHPLEIYF